MNHSAPRWQRLYAIPGMLIFGTATVVTQKLLFGQKAVGIDKYGEHHFRKPWFQTDSMFLGMTLSLLAYLVLRKKDEIPKKANWRLYFAAAAPSCCDLVATSLMNVQLLYIQASVWQMLRGSMVIFSSIFCAFILKRPHFPYMWWSIVVVVCALIIVGVSYVISTGIGKAGVSTDRVIMAILLTIFAQLIQATQLVIEDFILHDMTTHPLQLVGLKGFWGFIFCTSIFMPAVQFIDSAEGDGVHEDIVDTFVQIKNSPIVLVFVILYIFFILGYNIGGMLVINVFGAVVRTILEGCRTLCIWLVQVVLHYALMNNDYGRKNPEIGEELTIFSILQFSGFLLLFTGTLMYNKIIRLPFFTYPEDKPMDTSGYEQLPDNEGEKV